MQDSDFEIYTGKSFSDLCENIVDNQEEIKKQIDVLVGELKPLIKTVNDAIVVVPMIKDYLDVEVKNNEHLIKLAAITNRIRAKYVGDETSGGMEAIISEEEKAEITKHILNLQKDQNQLRIEKIKKEIK